jgi:hypothetical protein
MAETQPGQATEVQETQDRTEVAPSGFFYLNSYSKIMIGVLFLSLLATGVPIIINPEFSVFGVNWLAIVPFALVWFYVILHLITIERFQFVPGQEGE